MAAFGLWAAQAAASRAQRQQVSVCIQSLLMQINANAVYWVRTELRYFMDPENKFAC
jgi:hypothetical protein